jgi:hypothetical protein
MVVRASDAGRPNEVGSLRRDAGRGRMKKQDAERLADEEPTYVPVNEGAVPALWAVCEWGELARRVFRVRWYPCFKHRLGQVVTEVKAFEIVPRQL